MSKDKSKDKANERSELVRLRQQLELTQEELAEELGVTAQTVANWENGRAIPRLSIPQFKKLCRILRRSAEELPDNLGPLDIN